MLSTRALPRAIVTREIRLSPQCGRNSVRSFLFDDLKLQLIDKDPVGYL